MLNNLPFNGDYPIVQQFGDSPRSFRQVQCHDTPLRGHHGVDFALTEGAHVQSVADGVIVDSQYDRKGFGIYLLIEHHWGQTLYAHLSRVTVRAGQRVRAGDVIGRSGDSGLCLEPHLHFGMRINPYDVADRWCGYSDPMPYLSRLRFGRGPLMGPHIIGDIPDYIQLLEQWQPRSLVVLDPNPNEMKRLRAICPDTIIIGRLYLPSQTLTERIQRGPRAAARWTHEQTLSRLCNDVDYWQVANELLQDKNGLSQLNTFELERMQLADSEGYKCALFGFSVGNPDLPEVDRMLRWQQCYPALARAESHYHIVALHQYGMPNLWGPNNLYDWYIYRLEHQVLRRLPFKDLQFTVSELGIDGLIGGDEPNGWREYLTAADYVDQLLKSAAYTERYSGRVTGSAIFTLGHHAPWSSFEIEGDVATALAETSNRGTWSDVTTAVTDIVPGDFEPVHTPGVEALPDTDSAPVIIPPPEGESALHRRLDSRFDDYHMQIWPIDERPDRPAGDIVYAVKDIFMTANGSWETAGKPGQLPLWAKYDYWSPEFLEAGADHHLFGAVLGLDGKLTPLGAITFWSDGFHHLGDPNYGGFISVPINQASGWANMPMSGSSCFDPDINESGPWCWMPGGPAEVVCGGGLPLSNHVSTFVVWQAMNRREYDSQRHNSRMFTLPSYGLSFPLPRRLSLCVPHYRLMIRSLSYDAESAQKSPAYVVRDLFTVSLDGEACLPGGSAVPEWASSEYRIPVNSSANAKKAGDGVLAAPGLYAAVRSRNGVLLPAADVMFARDNFDSLRRDNRDDVAIRATDQVTRWAEMPLQRDEDAYRPNRRQSGPWSWAPVGSREAVSGGGLPDGKRISIYAVWEELPK